MASHGLAASNVPITQSHQPLQRYILVPGAVGNKLLGILADFLVYCRHRRRRC
jgi:hypothetical protein